LRGKRLVRMAGKSDQMFFQMVTLTPPFSFTLVLASVPAFAKRVRVNESHGF